MLLLKVVCIGALVTKKPKPLPTDSQWYWANHAPQTQYETLRRTELTNWWRGLWHSIFRSSPGTSNTLPYMAGPHLSPGRPYSGSTPSGHLWNTSANNMPVLPGPAAPFHQVLHHQFKLWPNSSLQLATQIRLPRATSSLALGISK